MSGSSEAAKQEQVVLAPSSGPGTFNALVLESIADGVVVPHSARLAPCASLTVECWAYSTGDRAPRNPTLVTKTDAAWGCGYGLVGRRAGEAAFWHSDLADDPALERVAAALEPRTWTHLCGVVDAGVTRLFVNGVLRAETRGAATCIDHGRSPERCELRVGHRLWGRSKFGFVGLVAELRVWDTAKSAADVAALMQGLAPDAASRRGLVLHMTFDPGMPDAVQGEGVRVPDLSGCGNDGTLVGNARMARLTPPPVPPFAPSFSLRAMCLSAMARNQQAAIREKAAAAAAAAASASVTVSPKMRLQPGTVVAGAAAAESDASGRGLGLTAEAPSPRERLTMSSEMPSSSSSAVSDGVPVQSLLKVSVPSLTFRLPGPAQLDIPVSERFLVSNPGVSRVVLSLPRDQSTHRYVLTFDPALATIKPGAAVEIKATITLLCTTMVHEIVRMGLFTDSAASASRRKSKKGENVPDAVQLLHVDIESELTTRLDYSELKHGERPIGEGSYGVVYRGEWRGLQVAIKKLKTQVMSRTELSEFVREVKMMERLRSPYIVNFIGAVMTEGHLALVTEFMQLGSVKALLTHKKLKSTSVKVRIVLDAAHGLNFLHQNSIIHRDVKNDNLLVVSLSKRAPVMVKLGDFGSSRSEAQGAKLEMTSGIGTPAFMAPEIIANKPYGKSADVYSFAMLIYELWIGRCPYSVSEFSNPWDIARFVENGRRLPVPAGMPQILASVMTACWAHDPAKRPTFEQVVHMLQQ